MKLASLALNTANRLASGTLSRWPLSLLVARWACVRAEIALTTAAAIAALAACYGHDVAEATAVRTGRLNTGPATEAKIVERNCAIVGWEVAAVELSHPGSRNRRHCYRRRLQTMMKAMAMETETETETEMEMEMVSR